MFSPLTYHEPVFRPPAEAFSAIFQITLGCSHNACAFCDMYKTKQFKTRSFVDVSQDISRYAMYNPQVKKVFLADGNALVLHTEKLLRILHEISSKLPRVRRISAYASPKDIVSKSPEELLLLRKAGLSLLYVGIESGYTKVLDYVSKGETQESTILGLQKAHEAGMQTSVMIINGLGGKKYSAEHALQSAYVVNQTQPQFTSLLVLSFPFGEQVYTERFTGVYESMSVMDLLSEVELFLDASQLQHSIFRTDHASNYLSLSGVLNRDKDMLLARVRNALANPHATTFRNEWERGL